MKKLNLIKEINIHILSDGFREFDFTSLNYHFASSDTTKNVNQKGTKSTL